MGKERDGRPQLTSDELRLSVLPQTNGWAHFPVPQRTLHVPGLPHIRSQTRRCVCVMSERVLCLSLCQCFACNGRTRVSSEFQTPAAGRVTTCRAASCEHERAHTTAREAPAAACHVPPAAHTLSLILLPLFLASELEQSARDNTSRALADFVGECFLEQVRERY